MLNKWSFPDKIASAIELYGEWDGSHNPDLKILRSSEQISALLFEEEPSIEQINDMCAQIATAAEEQTAVAEEVNSNIEQINSMTRETANGARETSKAGSSLSGLVTELQQMVNQFKV